jgi:hypothetical protein
MDIIVYLIIPLRIEMNNNLFVAATFLVFNSIILLLGNYYLIINYWTSIIKKNKNGN